jgi:hypothetical protein
MQCRFCAGEEPDEVRPILSLRKALKGIQAKFLIYHYPKRFNISKKRGTSHSDRSFIEGNL